MIHGFFMPVILEWWILFIRMSLPHRFYSLKAAMAQLPFTQMCALSNKISSDAVFVVVMLVA
jgi:hypothetical protein